MHHNKAMQEVAMVMPKMGESVMEAVILKWLKKEGDTIEEDTSIVEVATDKVDTEVPALYTGILKKILAKSGEVVAVGQPIALISTTLAAVPALENNNQQVGSLPIPSVKKNHINATIVEQPTQFDQQGIRSSAFYSPLVRKMAWKESISLEKLSQIMGTGKQGKVTKNDIENYLKNKNPIQDLSMPSVAQAKATVQAAPGDEIIQMDRMRQIIAERMLASKRISPHVTSFVEADVTAIVHWRSQHKADFKHKTGVNLTYMPVFIEAVVKAIQSFPMINVSIQDTTIIKKKAIHIGLAVALSNGNLIVPVIKHADQLGLIDLAKKIASLAHNARTNCLQPDDVTGATYTVSNIGSFKNLMGTPIIMQPQVAILAFGAIVKKPAVIETPQGDIIGIRHKMFLSHTYDHRVVDGVLGGTFAQSVATHLMSFNVAREIS